MAPVPGIECDVIMKGGITSGVVYPGVVCGLASTYRLRCIGGASAGAIGAAVAAAAEFNRAGGGFAKLGAVPAELNGPSPAGGSVLFRLFQPARATRGLYQVFASALGKFGLGRILSVALAVVTAFPVAVLLGAVLGVAVIVCGALGSGVAAVTSIVAGILLLVAGVAVGVGFALSPAVRAVPANKFGVCTGMPADDSAGAPPALTPWLHAKIQDIAGLPVDGDPLTFGMLAGSDAKCDLRMMTTNVTIRQAIRLPLDDNEYFFDPVEFRELFPEHIVAWMEDEEHWPPLPTDPAELAQVQAARAAALPRKPMPTAHLPVLVATRMSLSFPFLISAIPLYTVDWSKTSDPAQPAIGVNWFSDGGICSNLPVHFFDCPLPTRPTFAVDLAPFPIGQEKSLTDERENTYLPDLAAQRRLPGWGILSGTGFAGLGDFAAALFNSAQCWVDEAEAEMAGYHDRIVTVYQDKTEGGMNLTMTADAVSHLAERGRAAAGRLVERFAPDANGNPADGWENQRWIRFRTATAGLSDWLTTFSYGYNTKVPPATEYSDLAGSGAAAPLPSYPIDPGDRTAVNTCVGSLLTLAEAWSKVPNNAFIKDAPPDRPGLRLMPMEGFE